MKKKQIRAYTMAWDPKKNKGYVKIDFGKETKSVPIGSANEFTAVATILKESPVFVNNKGLIHTGWEEIEENI